ncbi:hypothetical protein [Macrococcus carouselicus]|uniref:Uncharacterized protein n=1 Tax=Macrococcus carouselicus TaxID=69969 RepID=A0A9Q8FPX2_9STAP|nr:hypothetical protein [Macrococcus carouselicus]TDM04685.1 hypothetical protein ERX40_05860 [Macrococcus carouselicus]
MEIPWIKELFHQKELIQQHLLDDNGYTHYQPYQLWIYGDSEFRLTATAELKPIAFNDIKSVHKI